MIENKNQVTEPPKKMSNDFLKLVIGIIAVIIFLIALKYLAEVLGIM